MTETMFQNVRLDEQFSLGVIHVGATGLTGSPLQEFLLKVANWLPAYQQWVITDLGLADGKNLHIIYRLGVALYNLESLSAAEQVMELAQSAKKGGWPFTLSVQSGAIERDEVAFSDLLKSHLIASLVIIASANDVGAVDWELLRRAVQVAKDNSVPVSIVGDYVEMQRHVLQDRWLDDTAFTVYPRVLTTPQQSRRRNCFGRVGCYVAPTGKIYPCQSLFGIVNAELGSIEHDRPFREADLSSLRKSMRKWELHSPSGAFDFTVKQRENGEMCQAHRAAMQTHAEPLNPGAPIASK